MAIFEDALRGLLIETNLVGPRVYLMRAQQTAAVPYIVFFHVAPHPYFTQQKPLTMQQRAYQISIFDSSQSRALESADALRLALDHLRRDIGGWRIGSCFYSLQTWGYEDDTMLFQVIQEYLIAFSPGPIPTTATAERTTTV